MLTFASKYGKNESSQFGENGILEECLKRINPQLKVAVEFGAPNETYCSNIYPLKAKGWTCHYFDDNTTDPAVTKMTITPDNINSLPKCSVASLDTDGHDHDLWFAYGYQPDIVIIEINSSLPPMTDHSSTEKGASYISMLTLGIAKGYFLICHTGNMIFARNEHRHLFPEIVGDGVYNWKEYFNTSHQ